MIESINKREAWNKGKLVGQKSPSRQRTSGPSVLIYLKNTPPAEVELKALRATFDMAVTVRRMEN